jgi:hypothetical protein
VSGTGTGTIGTIAGTVYINKYNDVDIASIIDMDNFFNRT